jgi:hypothetical protein
MRCPYCSFQIPPLWNPLVCLHDINGMMTNNPRENISAVAPDSTIVESRLQWMQCPNEKCHEILVGVSQIRYDAHLGPDSGMPTNWFAVPRRQAPRPLDSLVKGRFRQDYLEASSILADSPRMSAALSRKILADVLEKYAGRSEFNLEQRIDEFYKDPQYPTSIKGNLHHLREIGNFGVHTQTDKSTGEIIDVTLEEAEWTLTVLDGLFEYFIVGPEKDKQRRIEFDEKLKKAGRKQLKSP